MTLLDFLVLMCILIFGSILYISIIYSDGEQKWGVKRKPKEHDKGQ